MSALPLPLQFAAAWIGTWVARHQERTVEYLKAENRLLLEKIGGPVLGGIHHHYRRAA